MNRLTQKDEQGNWCLKGLNWNDLRDGKTLTKEMRDLLYGALWKLMEYEDTGYTPEQIQEFDTLYLEKCQEVNELRERTRWIPVEERLPEDKTDVLCFYRSRVGYEQMTVGFIEYGTWWSNEDGSSMTISYDDPVAWQSLPEPYNPKEPQESPCNDAGWRQRMTDVFLGGKR